MAHGASPGTEDGVDVSGKRDPRPWSTTTSISCALRPQPRVSIVGKTVLGGVNGISCRLGCGQVLGNQGINERLGIGLENHRCRRNVSRPGNSLGHCERILHVALDPSAHVVKGCGRIEVHRYTMEARAVDLVYRCDHVSSEHNGLLW